MSVFSAKDGNGAFKALAGPTHHDELQERSGQTLFELCLRLMTKGGAALSLQPTRD